MANYYPIEKCKSCKDYGHNKLRCMVDCSEFRNEMIRRAIEYNMTVSNGDIPEFDMGCKVLGYREAES